MTQSSKQQFDADLSELIDRYEQQGLSDEQIVDSLEWHLDLARSRQGRRRIRCD